MSAKVRGCSYTVRDFLSQVRCAPTNKVLLLALSVFADPDGSNIYPGHDLIRRLTGLAKSKIGPSIRYWLSARVLVLVEEARPKHAAEYRIDLERIGQILAGNSVSPVEPSRSDNSVPLSNRDKSPLGSHSVQKDPQLGSENAPLGSHSVPPVVLHGLQDHKKTGTITGDTPRPDKTGAAPQTNPDLTPKEIETIALKEIETIALIVRYIQNRIEHPYARDRKIARWSVINLARKYALGYEHAVELAHTAMAKFPESAFLK